MRFKLGMALGFGAGYVMGARAGRARYEQIERMARRAWNSPALEDMRGRAATVAEQVGERAESTLDRFREHRIRLDDEEIPKRVAPYVAAGHGADGGALPHISPLGS